MRARVDVLRISLRWVAESTSKAETGLALRPRSKAEARSRYSTTPKKCGTIKRESTQASCQ